MSAILEHVARRQISKSGFAQTREKQLAYADPKGTVLGQVGDVDEGQEPYAKFILCTRDVDGSGDVMEPKGCLKHLERFQRNPIWFYDHYAPDKQQRLKLPIGKADGPAGIAGKLDIQITDEQITLGCWFTQDTDEARDVYQLVKGKFLRCTSIAFLPHYAEKIRETGGLHYIEWEPTEASIVGVPDNPMTGTLEIKSLTLKRAWSQGVDLATRHSPLATTETDPMPAPIYAAIQFSKKLWTKDSIQKWLKTQKHDGSLLEEIDGSFVAHQAGYSASDWGAKKQLGKGLVGIVAVQKAKKSEAEKDADADEVPPEKKQDIEQTGKTGSDNAASGDTPTPTDKPAEEKNEGGDTDNDAAAVVPVDAGVMKDIYMHHKGVCEYSTQMKAHVPPACADVHKLLDEHVAGSQKAMEGIKNLATKTYPNLDFAGLVGEGEDDPGKDERSEEHGDNDQDMPVKEQKGAKAGVQKRINSRHKSVCKDAAEHLEEAAACAPNKCMKSAHLYHAKALNELIQQSDNPTPRDKDIEGGDDADVQMALKGLTAALAA